MKLPAIFLALALALSVRAELHTVRPEQVRVRLEPAAPVMTLGEPFHLHFIMENHSAARLAVRMGGDYRNEKGRQDFFKFTVAKVDGTPLPIIPLSMSFGGIVGPQFIPAHGEFTSSLFLQDWVVLAEPGQYRLRVERTLALDEPAGSSYAFDAPLTEVPRHAEALLTVLPADAARLGARIEAWGQALLNKSSDTAHSEAAESLVEVQDARALPILLEALRRPDYELKFTALRALPKFREDAALEGLREGLRTTPQDFPGSSPANAQSLASNICNAAAGGLSESVHPGARPFLLAQAQHPDHSVRLTVLHAAARMKDAAALAVVQSLADDTHDLVRSEARRYLRELAPQP